MRYSCGYEKVSNPQRNDDFEWNIGDWCLGLQIVCHAHIVDHTISQHQTLSLDWL